VNSWYFSTSARDWTAPAVPADAMAFHGSLPGYVPTPLIDVPALAAELSVGRVLVKDESARLGLPAFKVLGASWACQQVQARHPGAHFVAATDGNHGRAVARMAAHFGVGATVFVPAVILPETAERIAGEGATVVRVNGDYDEAVRRAAAHADADPAAHADADPGRALVQDTAWEGYTQVPAWIIEGYQTLLHELDDELAARGTEADLVAVPVGVGSLAEAVVRHYRQPDGPRPRVLSVEPRTAACVLASLQAGGPVTVPTDATVMAGLNCGTISASAWPVLREGLDAAVAVTDGDALAAVDDLAELGVSSGPCGAATLAGVRAVLSDSVRRAELHLPRDAVLILLSTEGSDNDQLRPPQVRIDRYLLSCTAQADWSIY
jgi:diaminopropionate ammonia-lyase